MLANKLFPGLQMDPQSGRMDSAESRFFERQLEAIDTELEKEDYPSIQYPNLIPVRENYDRGAVADVYRMLKQHGGALLIKDKSQKIPLVNVSAQETSTKIMPVAAGYGFSQMEILSAQKAGVDLEREDALTAAEVIERFLDKVAFIGDDVLGVKGLFNHASVHSNVAANGATASPLWSSKTAAEKIKDLVELVAYPRQNSLGIENPDTVVMSPDLYTDAATTQVPNTSDTVLTWFLRAQPWIKNVYESHYLIDIGSGTTDVMMCYRRDPTVLKMKIPCGLITLPAQYSGLNVEVYMFKTVSGLELRKPMALHYVYGAA